MLTDDVWPGASPSADRESLLLSHSRVWQEAHFSNPPTETSHTEALSLFSIQSGFALPIGGPRKRGSPKTLAMPVVAPSARYSLVKGERIVRSVLSARPHASTAFSPTLFYACPAPSSTQPYGTDACPAASPPTNPTCNLHPPASLSTSHHHCVLLLESTMCVPASKH